MTDPAPLHALTVDVEDWFCVRNLRDAFPFSCWDRQPLRVGTGLARLLGILADGNLRGTFFVLGWVAERLPDLVRALVDGGHEVGVHGYAHRPVTSLTPDGFARDLDRALAVLAPLVPSGALRGFRAPSFSLTPGTIWATDILAERGFLYDSSLFPLRGHPDYGFPGAPRHPFRFPNGLMEAPLPTALLAGRRVPFGGGGYFRLYPYSVTRFLWRLNEREGVPVVSYFHPWELDPDQPRVSLPLLRRFRHRVGLGRTETRLRRLVADFRFGPLWEVLRERMG